MRKTILQIFYVAALTTLLVASPYFSVETYSDWNMQLDYQTVRPITSVEWQGYMNQWDMFKCDIGIPYPITTNFATAELYVIENAPDITEEPGLVMTWGEENMPQGEYASGWVYEYGVDPDLSNSIIQITVIPPQFDDMGNQILNVSFGIKDASGAIRSWHWVCGPAGLPWAMPTTITIDTSITGLFASTPTASGYMNNPAFDITQAMSFIVDENANWVGGSTPIPAPGQLIAKPWNLWQDLIVKTSDRPNGMTVGINPEIHQDIENLELWPNDYHMEFILVSFDPKNPLIAYPPVLLSHVDDIFLEFSYSIVPLGSTGEGEYKVTLDWSNPANGSIPYCTIIHLGFEFEVINQNIVLDVKGWWTKDGVPIGELDPTLNNGGYSPILGFEIVDGTINPPPLEQFGLSQKLTLFNGGGIEGDSGVIPVNLVGLQIAKVSASEIEQLLGEYPFGQLNRNSPLQNSLPWQYVFYNGATVAPSNPVPMPPDSFFDVFFEIDLGEPMLINAGDFVVVREMIEFTNNNGIVEQLWSWHFHEAENGQSDLGDAPDDTNSTGAQMTTYSSGTAAKFPTTYQAGSPPYGPIHISPHNGPFLGRSVTLEWDADFGSDQDSTNNILPIPNLADLDFADDGIVDMPINMPHCQYSTFDYRVNLLASATSMDMYFNAWADFNRDGDWDDTLTCSTGEQVCEWIVQDQPVTGLMVGMNTITTPQFKSWHTYGGEDDGPLWLRITLSETKNSGSGTPVAAGSGPVGGYMYGETEDYLFTPNMQGVCDCADINHDGFIDFLDLVCMANQWLTSCR